MHEDAVAAVPQSAAPAVGAKSSLRLYLGRFRQSPTAMVSVCTIAAITLIALLAPILPLHDPAQQNVSMRFMGPSFDHWLGTDRFGRDVFSRLIYGARPSLTAAYAAAFAAGAIGVPLGLAAGYGGRWMDTILSRVSDAFLSVPFLILGLSIAGMVGRGLGGIILAIALVFWPRIFRVTRAVAREISSREFVDAGRIMGMSTGAILRRHVLRNAAPAVLVQLSYLAALGIAAEASFTFVGLGIQAPAPSWGTIISEAYRSVQLHPMAMIPPLAVIIVTVTAFAWIADGVTDAVERSARG